MNRVLVIQPGRKPLDLDWYAGDYADWVADGMGLAAHEWTVRYPQDGDRLPDVSGPVVVTGSGAMVTDTSPWIQTLKDWLRDRVDRGVPVLGICFGHQVLAAALGGTVRDNPNGIEVGTVDVLRTPEADALFDGLPERFAAQASHRQSVIRLPPGAVCLAHTALDPHHAFRVGRSCWGVQFHPEFDAAVMPAFIDFYAPDLPTEGGGAEALRTGLRATPESARVLKRFREHLKKTPVV